MYVTKGLELVVYFFVMQNITKRKILEMVDTGSSHIILGVHMVVEILKTGDNKFESFIT